MTTEPADEAAAGSASRGHLRASHAEREQVIETLKTCFAQGRLTKDEFDTRVGQAFTSRTHKELAAAAANIPAATIPAVPADGGPSREPVHEQARPPVSADVKTGFRAIAAIYLTAAILWLGALLAGDNALGASMSFLAFMATVVGVFFSLYGAVVLLDSRRRKHAGQHLPPGPGGKALRRRPDTT